MLVVDYSKYPLVKKLKELSSQEIINLTKQIFGEQGILEEYSMTTGRSIVQTFLNELLGNGDLNTVHNPQGTSSQMAKQSAVFKL